MTRRRHSPLVSLDREEALRRVRAQAVARLDALEYPADHPIIRATHAKMRGVSPNTSRLMSAAVIVWLRYCEGEGLDPTDLQQTDAQAYDQWLQERYAPTTAHTSIAMLRVIYKIAHGTGSIPRNPFLGVSVSNPDPLQYTPALTKQEFERLVAMISQEAFGPLARVASKRDLVVFYVTCRIGLRCSEVTGIHWGDLSHDRGVPVVRILGKGRRYATVTLPDDVARMLAWWRAICEEIMGRRTTDEDAVFPSIGKNGEFLRKLAKQKRPLVGVGRRSLYRVFSGIFTRAGIEGDRWGVHVARATAATIGYEHSGDLLGVANMLRHKNLTTTQRYIRRIGDARTIADTWTPTVVLPVIGAPDDEDEPTLLLEAGDEPEAA
jgi:integrase/recombinase XerC